LSGVVGGMSVGGVGSSIGGGSGAGIIAKRRDARFEVIDGHDSHASFNAFITAST
jgi:hypothetical protein